MVEKGWSWIYWASAFDISNFTTGFPDKMGSKLENIIKHQISKAKENYYLPLLRWGGNGQKIWGKKSPSKSPQSAACQGGLENHRHWNSCFSHLLLKYIPPVQHNYPDKVPHEQVVSDVSWVTEVCTLNNHPIIEQIYVQKSKSVCVSLNINKKLQVKVFK